MERDSFYNGNAQIAAFKRDGLLLPTAPIESYIIFRASELNNSEKLLPFSDLKSAIQPVSVFYQGNGNITFRVKQIFPVVATIHELTVTSSGYQFPLMALDPQLYMYAIQCSNSALTNITIFAKFVDIYQFYSIV